MTRILLVCLGNICRSPLACSAFHAWLAARGLLWAFEVDSAGTYAGHPGAAADRRAVALALAHGWTQISRARARRVTEQDFERFDLILAMDRSNLLHLQRQCPPRHRHKLHLFLEYAALDGVREVPDPYFGNDAGFQRVLHLCAAGAQGVLERLTASAPPNAQTRP
ncbi:low molecular weight protein-tyrosine-phosphatase [Hydrogenophaga sp.]|uniref:low molecular weight protein-tyrosine-phosphatase n=1 Tax=Hydrogenophaga sp. TaxID=1904254 RepID=UPI0019A27AA8|nr:low molecular weight protein-tyrosine-phosphatase [Hydrogenophaga sp.]MBD3893538.1 low molecular weight phosphotyrosine protein phosphatase [Hydrogenophaga sp.]